MSAWHKHMTVLYDLPDGLSADTLHADGYLVISRLDGGYDVWQRQQPLNVKETDHE